MSRRKSRSPKIGPAPKFSVADPALTRPDWTAGAERDPARLWLDKNENSDPEMAAVVRDVAARVSASAAYSYPDLAGLYAKLARFCGVSPENLVLAAGSDGAIRATFEAYISPGDVVVHTQPTFAMYAVYCRMFGADARPLAYRPSNHGPHLAVDDVLDAITGARPKLVCLPNPDSPTGTVFSADEMRAIIEAAARQGALVLVDEAYYPFHPETVLPWVRDHDNLIVTRSTGKAWGMAGFRIGYAAAAEPVVVNLHKVRPMYEVGAFSAAVFEGMLDHEDAMWASVCRLEAGKTLFLDEMEKMNFQVLRGAGNFLHVAFSAQADAVHAALADLVYYRADFGDSCLKGFSRFSSTTEDAFRPVIDRIRNAVSNG